MRRDSRPSQVFTSCLVDVLLEGPRICSTPNRAVNPAGSMNPKGPISSGK